jgi:hypothetical protein
MRAALKHVVQGKGVRWEISQLIFDLLDQDARAARIELDRLLADEE